jgi:Helix-turn-helix domain of resolvase
MRSAIAQMTPARQLALGGGLALAQAGWPPKLQAAQEMYRSGQYTVAAIATTLGVSRASIYRHLTGDSR